MTQSIEQIYDKYNATLYGMIIYNVKGKNAALSIMKDVFNYINTHYSQKDPGLFKLLNIARQFTCTYMSDHKDSFTASQVDHNCTEVTNDYILKLLTIGRFTISQISNLLSIEEGALKKRIHIALLEFRNKITPLPISA
jgi:hypothetical protein